MTNIICRIPCVCGRFMYTRDMKNKAATPRFTWEKHPAYSNINILIDSEKNVRHCMIETTAEQMSEYVRLMNRH